MWGKRLLNLHRLLNGRRIGFLNRFHFVMQLIRFQWLPVQGDGVMLNGLLLGYRNCLWNLLLDGGVINILSKEKTTLISIFIPPQDSRATHLNTDRLNDATEKIGILRCMRTAGLYQCCFTDLHWYGRCFGDSGARRRDRFQQRGSSSHL